MTTGARVVRWPSTIEPELRELLTRPEHRADLELIRDSIDPATEVAAEISSATVELRSLRYRVAPLRRKRAQARLGAAHKRVRELWGPDLEALKAANPWEPALDPTPWKIAAAVSSGLLIMAAAGGALGWFVPAVGAVFVLALVVACHRLLCLGNADRERTAATSNSALVDALHCDWLRSPAGRVPDELAVVAASVRAEMLAYPERGLKGWSQRALVRQIEKSVPHIETVIPDPDADPLEALSKREMLRMGRQLKGRTPAAVELLGTVAASGAAGYGLYKLLTDGGRSNQVVMRARHRTYRRQLGRAGTTTGQP